MNTPLATRTSRIVPVTPQELDRAIAFLDAEGYVLQDTTVLVVPGAATIEHPDGSTVTVNTTSGEVIAQGRRA